MPAPEGHLLPSGRVKLLDAVDGRLVGDAPDGVRRPRCCSTAGEELVDVLGELLLLGRVGLGPVGVEQGVECGSLMRPKFSAS